MTDRPRTFVWWTVAAAGLLTAALVSFLTDLTSNQSPPSLTVSDVEGTWSASGDERLMVRADGSAELAGVTEPEVNCGQHTGPNPSRYTGPATWVFDTYPDESPGIRFDYPGPATGKTCRIHLSLSISDQHGTRGFLPHAPDQSYTRGAG
ncbi:hypothetical protein DEJ50_32240 [Streptomyces venezuelae]|uniref:Uncharacterized protein n=1 Tax=Streptomyces venezuelae TaxID=54571 RepID=A0A5P2DBC3_STRVZ|nr:hypothetical protein [Streptomyces venezuelae]QES51830.1 hypothetical protein DEJ50_32240 [Streptomyces venezuelae]